MDYRLELADRVAEIDGRLTLILSRASPVRTRALEAAEYSVSSGGKRLRGVLLTAFYDICAGTGGVSRELLVDFACAVELIHAFSLIHDDLPCMDDDDMRRGKPACHIVFGEGDAVLAGDGLLCLAFETALSAASAWPDTGAAVRAARELASAAGFSGMTAGQSMDITELTYTGDSETSPSAGELSLINGLKTGALIKAPAAMGCILAGAGEDSLAMAREYAACLGEAFQITDDILDAAEASDSFEKNPEQNTYPAVYGLAAAKKMASDLTERAKRAAEAFTGADFLVWLAGAMADRKK